MKIKKFDHFVRSLLNSIPATSTEDVWSVFEKRLNAEKDFDELSENITFDQKVKQEFSTLKPNFNVKHWLILKEQLNIIENRKNTIYIAKIMEYVAMFLISFTFFNLSGYLSESKTTKQKSAANHQYATIASPILETKVLPSVESEKKNAKKYLNDTKDFKPSNDQKIEITSGPSEIKPKESAELNVRNTKIMDALVVTEHPNNMELAEIELEPNNISIYQEAENSQPIDASILTHQEREEYPPIDDISYITQSINPVYSEKISPLNIPFSLSNSKVKHSFSLYACADVNLINTPFDKLYSLASYNKEALNNSYGFNISSEKSNVEVETGFGYSKRIYQPEFISEAYGQFGEYYFEKSLNKISYDIISTPLNLKFHFINNSAWSAYILAGATLNLIVNAEYDIVQKLKEGRPANRFAPEQARLYEKGFTPGLFNDGSLKDNYFASVGFGFGIVKKLYKSTSLYFQPSYQRHILSSDIGIGPNKDKIHTASLQIGIKSIIN